MQLEIYTSGRLQDWAGLISGVLLAFKPASVCQVRCATGNALCWQPDGPNGKD